MEPPTFTIFVDASDEESVVSTRLRAMGNCTSPRLRNGWPHRKTRSACTAVTVHAELIESVSLHQHHAGHVAGLQLRVIRARRRGAALRGDESITLQLMKKIVCSAAA